MSVFDVKETICWHCGKACTNGCRWSRSLRPVEGWKIMKNRQGICVLYCPEYVSDKKTGKLEEVDRDGLVALAEASARLIREDYIRGRGYYDYSPNRKGNHGLTKEDIRRANRRLIEKSLLSEKSNLFPLSNPEEVIRMLRDLAEEHDEAMANMMRLYKNEGSKGAGTKVPGSGAAGR